MLNKHKLIPGGIQYIFPNAVSNALKGNFVSDFPSFYNCKYILIKRVICFRRNCTYNPQCLTGLGEDKYMKSQPAEVMSLESSLSELRDPTQYVGLKNLGATCYVNSLI